MSQRNFNISKSKNNFFIHQNKGIQPKIYNTSKLIKNLRQLKNNEKNYDKIGSYQKKFNFHLGKISKIYGNDSSGERFVSNPLMEKILNLPQSYNQYKNNKILKNKYIKNNRCKYKYKL